MSTVLDIEFAGGDADFTEVHALLTQAFAQMAGRIDPPSSLTRMEPEDLAQMAEEHGCLIARQEETLVGCLFLEDRGDRVYLSKLAVSPAHQRAGIGRALIESAETVARTLSRPLLQVKTRVELTENHAFFARLGFVETGRTAHPGYDRPTSVTLEKQL